MVCWKTGQWLRSKSKRTMRIRHGRFDGGKNNRDWPTVSEQRSEAFAPKNAVDERIETTGEKY